MADSGADRQRRYRERQAGRLAPVERLTCPACGISHLGARDALCSRCWERLTPEGRAYKADRVARSRARKRDRDGCATVCESPGGRRRPSHIDK